MQHRVGAAAFSPLDQSWTNYRWTGTNFVLQSFGPDANHMYPLQNPAQQYSINDLLLQWESSGFAAGAHQFKAEFFKSDGSSIAAPAQTLTLRVDNNLPLVQVVDVRHNGASVPVCDIVNLTDSNDGVQVVITARDVEGHLRQYSLQAHYGENASVQIASGSYPVPHPANHQWLGVTNQTVPPSPQEFIPPTSCAYQFRLSAWPRVTNGYAHIGYAEATRHVTLIKPGAARAAAAMYSEEISYGLSADRHAAVEGREPSELGEKTVGR
jgi:hypothetical protein